MSTPTLVWFRNDLRLKDNPALCAAVAAGAPVVPVFVWSPDEEGDWAPGGASRWWLHQSLASLDADLRRCGSRLIIRRGPAGEALCALARETGAGAFFLNRRWQPAGAVLDAALETALRAQGVRVVPSSASLLWEPPDVATTAGTPYRVFTPFWRACRALPEPAPPLPAPAHIPSPERLPDSLPLDALGLEPQPDWAGGLCAAWQPGEAGARARLERLTEGFLGSYPMERDLPGREGTSRLSPHLHFGEVSPRQVWHAIRPSLPGAEAFLRQLAWREFAHHLLHHFPRTPAEPLRPEFARMPWESDPEGLRAWQRGRTGYPIVDAGMRELWQTGWMHNRVRMIVASFLVKDLLLPWQRGAEWFWETLVDADLADNTLGWQWAAGCGADAAPYFRVFNPVAQGEKWDPDGAYVRRWVPELARLPDRWVHRPWEAPSGELRAAEVVFGKTYPAPILDHAAARTRALAAFRSIRGTREDMG